MIRIVPANPTVIYVPQYDPQVIYVEPSPSFGFITFGIGFTIGAWLDRDCDWRRHRVFYHGWRGGGWIGRARPHIRDVRHVYINNNVSAIKVNRTVMQRDTANYRNRLRTDAQRRTERLPAPAPRGAIKPRETRPQVGTSQERRPQEIKPRETRPQQIRQKETRPGEIRPGERGGVHVETPRHQVPAVASPAQRPDNKNLYRGREVKGPQPAARSGYGGYGSGNEATIYRQRGEQSIGSMGRFNRPQTPAQVPHAVAPQLPVVTQPAPRPAVTQPAPRPAPAPAQRPAPPAGGGAQQQRHR